MSTKPANSEIQRALEQLVAQFIHHPAVTLIDAGYAQGTDPANRQVVLRIHVSDRDLTCDPAKPSPFPTSVGQLPVVVIPGNFRPEAGG
jgi:hypothetical protein